MPNPRVVVAMSGGVDSAVAAARLVDAGYDVVGVTLHLWDYDEADPKHGRCCAPEDQYDARRTADALGFAHFTFDRRELFARTVVAPFVDAYLGGVTPSPCAACNRGIKMPELVSLADRLGARYLATGHYARVVEGGRFLARAKDESKDQSYFLYATPEAVLARVLFPIGESTKSDVRREAAARKLPGADKGESQELCFVPQRPHAYAAFVEARSLGRVRPGPIVDGDGRAVGEHDGVHHFTVGQRRGLGVASSGALYVTQIDAASAEVRLGPESQLLARFAALEDTYVSPHASLPRRLRVRVRYRHEGALALVSAGAEGVTLEFDEPVRALARGQIAVFYDDDRVVGGGRIARAR